MNKFKPGDIVCISNWDTIPNTTWDGYAIIEAESLYKNDYHVRKFNPVTVNGTTFELGAFGVKYLTLVTDLSLLERIVYEVEYKLPWSSHAR